MTSKSTKDVTPSVAAQAVRWMGIVAVVAIIAAVFITAAMARVGVSIPGVAELIP